MSACSPGLSFGIRLKEYEPRMDPLSLQRPYPGPTDYDPNLGKCTFKLLGRPLHPAILHDGSVAATLLSSTKVGSYHWGS